MATATKKQHKESIANAYRESMKGRISDAQIEENVNKLTADGLSSYPAVGNVVGGIIYDKLQCTISDSGEQFNGHVWGFGTPGAGFLTGDVWTSDLPALLQNTVKVTLVAQAVYTSFIFSDENGNGLGSFQAGSISTVAGGGKGSGSWS
jgi:Rhodococcus equi virulence-associated protein